MALREAEKLFFRRCQAAVLMGLGARLGGASSHFSPGLAPQVGQRIASVFFLAIFILSSCSFAGQQDAQF
jgi:hypothetical protein